MRLSEYERDAIRSLADIHFGKGRVIRLFGSRVDDARRGGDIDLHIVAEAADRATLDASIRFVSDLEDRIGEQRIDVVLRAPKYAPRAIDEVAMANGVVL